MPTNHDVDVFLYGWYTDANRRLSCKCSKCLPVLNPLALSTWDITTQPLCSRPTFGASFLFRYLAFSLMRLLSPTLGRYSQHLTIPIVYTRRCTETSALDCEPTRLLATYLPAVRGHRISILGVFPPTLPLVFSRLV